MRTPPETSAKTASTMSRKPAPKRKHLVTFMFLVASAGISASRAQPTAAPPASGPISSSQTSSQTSSPQSAPINDTQSASNTWIDSILIHVESLNLNSPAHQAQLQHSDTPDVQPDSSQAPTDSAEDPLESPATTTQYALAAPADNEQLLVDSNNVSAVLQHSASASDAPPEVFEPLPEVSAASEPATTTSRPVLSCEQAYTQCALRKACAPALKAYNDDCQELILNRTSQCSAKCLKAMIALRSSEEGDDLVQCDCQGNEYCLQSRQRSLACKPQVEQAVDPATTVSCSTASWICLADQLCSTALDYYYRNCQTLFSQRHCSMRCNNSLAILHRQPKASKLVNCFCDGSEEFPCVKYKTYTERICLHKYPGAAVAVADYAQPQQINAPTVDEFNEDDNMTNEPDVLIPMASSASQSSANDADEGEQDLGANGADDYEDANGNANDESWPTGTNGIQSSVEDNWIPLMSGRYFTNLQRQQHKHRQLQYQQLQSQSQHNKQQVLSQHQQQTRKSQKSGQKQKSQRPHSASNGGFHEHIKRSRHGRIVMFASSSATGPHQHHKVDTFWIRSIFNNWLTMAMLLVVVAVHRNQCF